MYLHDLRVYVILSFMNYSTTHFNCSSYIMPNDRMAVYDNLGAKTTGPQVDMRTRTSQIRRALLMSQSSPKLDPSVKEQ